jgi:hypothetical protein
VCFNIGQDKFSREANNVTAHDVTFLDTAAKSVFHFFYPSLKKGRGKKAALDATKPSCNASASRADLAIASRTIRTRNGCHDDARSCAETVLRATRIRNLKHTEDTDYNGWSEGETFIRHLPRRAKLCASPTARERRLVVTGSRPGLAARGQSVRFTRWGFP